jgi:Transmembrane exosortase (Exosortase_EpsH).
MLTKADLKQYATRLAPFKGVFIFIVAMMAANWFWKIFVHDGNYDTDVTFLGINITGPFIFEQKEIIRVVSLVFELFNIPFAINHGTMFEFANRQSSEIAWGCTGLKQAFIFACIITFSRGSWKHKWWYILAGLLVVHMVNVLRITVVGVVLSHNPEAFDIVHTYFFKYIFYLIIFLMWVMWEEYFFKKSLQKTEKTGATANQ